MFSDPVVAVMAILILFFLGSVLMFLCVMRSFATQKTDMRDALRKQQALISDLERQLMEMSFALRVLQDSVDSIRSGSPKKNSQADPNQMQQENDLMGMLETTRKKSVELGFEDDLFSPGGSPAHPLADLYTPQPSIEESFLAGQRSDRTKRGL